MMMLKLKNGVRASSEKGGEDKQDKRNRFIVGWFFLIAGCDGSLVITFDDNGYDHGDGVVVFEEDYGYYPYADDYYDDGYYY